MSAGIQYIKVNGVDKSDIIDSFTITMSQDISTATLNIVMKFNQTLTGFAPGNAVIIKTTDNYILFYGKLRNTPQKSSSDLSRDVYNVLVDDVRMSYETVSVTERFKKNTTIGEALRRLITNYTSDTFGTDNTNPLTYCAISLNGVSLKEAISQVLSLSDILIRWVIRYDEGTNTVYHDFTRSFFTNVGTLDYVELQSGLFQVNEGLIKNRVEVYSSDVLWSTPDIQYWYYDKDPNTKATEHQNRLKVALKRPLKSTNIYLLIGEKSNDYGKRMKAVKMHWPNVQVTDSKDGGLIGLDPQVFLQGGYYVPPSLSQTSSGVVIFDYATNTSNITLNATVYKEMFNRLIPDGTIYLHTVATPGYNYGTCYVPTLDWMVKHIDLVNKYLGQVIDPDRILGWAIASFISQPKKHTENDLTSQATYGIRPLPIEQLKTTSAQALVSYAKALLAYHSQVRYTGNATVCYWNNGDQLNTDYVKYGDLVDLLHYLRGDQSDVCCQEVTYTCTQDEMKCQIGASKDGKSDMLLWVAKKLKLLIEGQQQINDADVKTTITVTDSLKVECDVSTVLLNSTTTKHFGGMLRRLWFG